MALHARRGTGYVLDGARRLVGRCVTPGCPGKLRAGRDGSNPVITCGQCDALWPVVLWPELKTRMDARDHTE